MTINELEDKLIECENETSILLSDLKENPEAFEMLINFCSIVKDTTKIETEVIEQLQICKNNILLNIRQTEIDNLYNNLIDNPEYRSLQELRNTVENIKSVISVFLLLHK